MANGVIISNIGVRMKTEYETPLDKPSSSAVERNPNDGDNLEARLQGGVIRAPEEHRNHWVDMQEKYARGEGHTKLLKPEAKKARILPGVIRHTSCPDNTLAYYYNYAIK